MDARISKDNVGYFKYTGPMRMDKAISTLAGLILGITADAIVNQRELDALEEWLRGHSEFARRHPFNEIIPVLTRALQDQVLTEEEKDDLLWLCDRMVQRQTFYDANTLDMQRLHAILGAIACDGKVNEKELRGLSGWLDEHVHLRTCWPFDEIESLVTGVLKDGKIDDNEHTLLLTFMSEFTHKGVHKALELPLNEVNTPITGLCAVCPEIIFPGKTFTFTGASAKLDRRKLAELVTEHGGNFSEKVTQQIDYLVIGGEGNPCWAFACYGRKVERAIRYRKQGCKLLLVHEFDFWDAIADTSA